MTRRSGTSARSSRPAMCSRTVSALKYSSAALRTERPARPASVAPPDGGSSDGEVIGAGKAAEQHALRLREPADQHRQREDRTRRARPSGCPAPSTAAMVTHRDHELRPADAPQLAQLVEAEHALHRREHQRRQQRLRQAHRRVPVRYTSTTAIHAEHTTTATGVRAPPASLTSDCDRPPPDGKPWPKAIATLAAPCATSSRLGSIAVVVAQREQARRRDRLRCTRAGSTRRRQRQQRVELGPRADRAARAAGCPAGIVPTVAMVKRRERGHVADQRDARAATTMSGIGQRGRSAVAELRGATYATTPTHQRGHVRGADVGARCAPACAADAVAAAAIRAAAAAGSPRSRCPRRS